MDTADGADLEKVQARREKHKARGINGNGFGESLSEKAQVVTDNWRGPSDLSKRGGSQAPEKRKAGGHSVNLEDQAEHWMGPRTATGAYTRDRGDPEKERPSLEGQASNWAGPKASDAEKAGPNMRGSKGDIPLPAQAMNWAGPAAQNHKGSSQGSITRADGKSRADILSYQAEQFFHPPSSPDQPMAGGSMSSTDGPNSNQPSAKRKLNPIFVEALMRWPTGLSGFERQETAWTRWWLLMPTFVSTLCTPPPEPKQMTLL